MTKNLFVQDFLSYVDANLNGMFVVYRSNSPEWEERQKDPKAVCARHELGEVRKVVTTVVRSLTVNDFVTIQPDLKNNLGDLYVFRKRFKGVMLYVKLQISTRTGKVTCHSFHEWTNR